MPYHTLYQFKFSKLTLAVLLLLSGLCLRAENGYDAWLRYPLIKDTRLLTEYRNAISGIIVTEQSPTLQAAKQELQRGIEGIIGKRMISQQTIVKGSILLITPASTYNTIYRLNDQLASLGTEGFLITSRRAGAGKAIIIAANTDKGVLYGVFHLLRLLQTAQPIANLSISSTPLIQLRLLNHWDNLDRTVERGYAGFSLWNWHTLPGYTDQRYIDYARLNASIGINGTVLTNVNANATILTPSYLLKVKALADVFRVYGIKVYLTARFSAPVETGGLKTADPLDPDVQQWWNKKVTEIYTLIPDFGGFLVKANSEGQPGPQNYGRTHADGANMLARAVAPHKGIVMWRAFVYSNETPDDRHKQAYNEFTALDGKFDPNVMVQVKNGAIDFQPREPFHPLFGAMPGTSVLPEFQLTQEYLGFATHLVYLAPLFKECLDSDTYRKGKGSTVASIIDASTGTHPLSGIAGVSNTGTDINWTGHPFAQANWYAFGRLAWDHQLSAADIASEWLGMSFTNDPAFIKTIQPLMLASREILVDYMTPIGLHHLMGTGHHYGPAPWINNLSRADWNPVYYHQAAVSGIGFDRTATGSNALSQYAPELQKQWGDPETCDEKYLLWFHHLPWTYQLNTKRNLWEEICYRYNKGVDSVRWMQKTWRAINGKIDQERYLQISQLLKIQEEEAVWWRDACLLYFQGFSKMPVPDQYEKPRKELSYYKQLEFPYAPGH